MFAVNEKLLQAITEFEGFSSKVYNDTAGNPTIGYGHLLKPDEAKQFAKGIDKKQAIELLKVDVEKAIDAVNQLVRVPLNQNQFNALVSFVYNIGASAFKKSTLLKKLNAGDYGSVPAELRKWIFAGGHPSVGLGYRRVSEGKIFSGDLGK